MGYRSLSQDSTYIIRKNPLNITQLDGSDLILSKNHALEVNSETDHLDYSFDIDKNKHPGLVISELVSDKEKDKVHYELPGSITVKRPVTINPPHNSPQKLAKEINTIMENTENSEFVNINLETPSSEGSGSLDMRSNASTTGSELSEPSDDQFIYRPIEKIELPILDSPELFSSFQDALNASMVYAQPLDSAKTTPVTAPTTAPVLLPTTSKTAPLSPPKISPGLGRKNTITSNHDTVSAPSSYEVLQRLKKARQKAHSPLAQLGDDSYIVEQLKRPPSSMTSPVVDNGQEIIDLSIASANDDAESIYENESHDEPEARSSSSSPILSDPLDDTDRGRLFLKISGIKDLHLPLDRKRRPRFTLTLDNGLQNVTTYPIDLLVKGKEVSLIPIDHEFELVVGKEDLQVVLTLSGQMDPLPKPRPSPPPPIKLPETYRNPSISPSVVINSPSKSSPSTPPASPKKKKFGFFSRSPKKKEEPVVILPPEPPVEIERSPSPVLPLPVATPMPAPKDVWAGKVGKNGEFSRAYLVESQFENEIYGRPQTFILSCFNEFTTGKAKTAPYRICGLQVTMMFIPRLHRTEDLPSSMNASLAELNNVAQLRRIHFNGYLSQQGGDCRFWRKRWFNLEGPNLIGHHEETRKARNMINLANVVSINYSNDSGIYDERAFKMEFQDGEVLSFYSDTIEERDKWMEVLNLSLTHCTGQVNSWYDLVLQRLEENKRKKSMLSKKYQVRKQLSDSGNSTFKEEMEM